MHQLTANPLTNVGPVKLGATREAVRAAAGPEFEEFAKSSSSENTTDDYGSFHVYYDENDTCVAVEVFPEIEQERFPEIFSAAAVPVPPERPPFLQLPKAGLQQSALPDNP